MTSFVYSELPSANHVRILEILPVSVGGYLQCILHTCQGPTSGNVDVAYDSLSYTWGSSAKTELISVNGAPFHITSGLLEALLCLRRAGTKYLWVDAICLNQDDLEEKNVHIQNMRNIYMHARGVEAWLGPAMANSDLVMEFCAQHEVVRAESANLGGQQPSSRHIDTMSDSLKQLGSKARLELDAAIYALLARPWFGRVWVQQEATINPQTRLRCGDKAVDLDTALLALTIYMDQYHISSGHYTDLQRIRELRALASKISHSGIRASVPPPISSGCLLDMVSAFQRCEATEPRDKIVAAAAFTEESGRNSVVTHAYSISVLDLYQAFAVENLRMNYIGLGILGYTSDFQGTDLPTWVPDWRDSNTTRIPFAKRLYTRRYATYSGPPTYLAGISSRWWSPPKVNFTMCDSKHTLTLQAAHITALASTFAIPFYSQLTASRHVEWLADIPFGRYASPAAVDFALRRTLVADLSFGFDELPKRRGAALDWPASSAPGKQVYAVSGAMAQNDDVDQQFAYEVATAGRRLAVTTDGQYALVPRTAREGDGIVVIEGGQVLYVVRRARESEETFDYVGEAYVDGLMDGEAMREKGGAEMQWEELVLR